MPPVKRKGKGESIIKFLNPEDLERFVLFGSRRIRPKRGINMTIFQNTFILETVNTMGWNIYVRTPNMAALELVRKFYYAMVPYQFLHRVPMMVQGRPVQITAHGINQWLDTHTDLSHLIDGLPENEQFEPWNWELAVDLRLDGDPAWNDHRHPLLHSQLKLDTGLWYMFFSFSLSPSTHRTELGYNAARFIYCARNGLCIDIGQIIMKQIFTGGHSSKGPLPFPCLITHFCVVTGINVHEGGWTMFPPMTDMGKWVYNDLAKHRGARLLEDQGDEDDLEDDPNDSDYNVVENIDAIEDDTGPMMDRMLRAI
ncbi:hypothetical protein Ddye_018156 [Dipteronia dyeriana]|uniref:Putative plant transposon protein domain-containing protein n=1 Tax=Dipteronia dyeriana TaxID=168575 RepID=A0AAD9UAQ7_9ROSI|nr:hypothetical protein Ddye_018156 [Dipteronia dyeriana]